MSVHFRRRKVSVSEQSIKGTGHFGVNAVHDRRQRLKQGTDLLARVFEMKFRQVFKRRGVIQTGPPNDGTQDKDH